MTIKFPFAAIFAVFACATAISAHTNSVQKTPAKTAAKSQSSTRNVPKLQPKIVVSNQPLVNSTIIIKSFTLDRRGWVMSHLQGKGGKPGTMAGVTGPFEPGTYKNVRIKLWGDIQSGDKVWPMLHYDNGPKKGVFEPKDDHHVDVSGKTVTKQIIITAVKGTKPKAGNFIVMPAMAGMSKN